MTKRAFTLLELLVVAAILAAIAGTATIALQDTDARASAAAHVAMMDELNKGVRTFRVLNRNQLPNNFDSLIETSTAVVAKTPIDGDILSIAAIEDVETFALTQGIIDVLSAGGIDSLQYVDSSLLSSSADITANGTFANVQALVESRANAVVAGNIFLTPKGNGCGVARKLEVGDEIALWNGGEERITGQAGKAFNTAGAKAYMAVGFGPASTLFNANDLGGMTSVPVYRHVGALEYNRFIGLFDIGTFSAADTIAPADQVVFVGVVDGAGDTKEEELGEWDGSRNTI